MLVCRGPVFGRPYIRGELHLGFYWVENDNSLRMKAVM